jgi:hypothetical protein
MNADFDDAVLGHGLPAEAEAALREAGLHRADPPRAMAQLMRAQTVAPDHPAVLIALYRDHFYGHRHAPARDIARRALLSGAQALSLPACWRDVPKQPLDGARDDPSVRFYLFSLKGYAYLSMRLGDMEEAREALLQLRALDPDDFVGGALLEGVRQRREQHVRGLLLDDEDQPTAPAVFGKAAWDRLGV